MSDPHASICRDRERKVATMTTAFLVKGFYGKHTPVNSTMSAKVLSEWKRDPSFRVDSIEEVEVNIPYRTSEGCERCKVDAYVPHYNCLYNGRAIGHSMSHCTADSCY